MCVPAIRALAGRCALFGVCLGHQCMIEAFGGKVGRAPAPVHGKPSMIAHDDSALFRGVENPFQAGRYHSLAGVVIPPVLRVTARAGEVVMAVEHRAEPIFGTQFHPESILTPSGARIVDNLLAAARPPGAATGS